MSVLKCIGERFGNVSRQCERSAGLLHLNGEGVVETDATGQSMRRVGARKCIDMAREERQHLKRVQCTASCQ